MLKSSFRAIAIIGRLVKSIFKYTKIKILWVLLLSVSNVIGQYLFMYCVLMYATFRFSTQESNFESIYIGILGHSDGSVISLVIIGIISASISIIAGKMYADFSFKLSQGYMNYSVLGRIGQLIVAIDESPTQKIEPIKCRKLLTADALILLRAARIVLQSVLPLVMLLVAGFVTIYIAPKLTIILFFGSGIFFFVWAAMNRSVIHASRKREDLSTVMSRSARDVLQIVFESRNSSDEKYEVVNKYLGDHDFKDYINAMRTILVTRDHVRILHTVFFFLVLVLVVGFYEFPSVPAENIWQVVIVYIFSMRFLASASVTLAVNVTGLSRLLPQFSRITETLEVVSSAKNILYNSNLTIDDGDEVDDF